MQISIELIERMLESLDTHPANFMLVSELAKSVDELSQNKNAALTGNFVSHLLHLQDLECFVNLKDEISFGYKAKKDTTTGEGFSHQHNNEFIRLTAKGRELLDVLKSDTISEKGKVSAMRIGGQMVTALLIKAVTGA